MWYRHAPGCLAGPVLEMPLVVRRRNRRAAEPDDIADAVIYLATGTTLTTGQVLVVDGGRTM